jgi:elongation factor P
VAPVSTNEFRNGMHIELDGQTWRIVEFQHVKPGKGGAFVRTKLKAYDSGDEVIYMDEENYEQLSLPRTAVEDALPFMQPSSSVQVLFVGERASGVDLPASVVLEVTDPEPGVKGDTVSNVTKPATLETGGVVQVPLFVNIGDKIKVDPRERRYISRA